VTDWKAVIDGGFRLPEGMSQQDAVAELAGMLRNPDPVVRDEHAYTVLSQLIPGLDRDVGVALGDEMAGRLTDQELHARSFAALVLASVVERGLFRRPWLDAFATWYPRERDLRGYDPELGWLHAAAHGADLLGAFGLHEQVSPVEMLDLAVQRLRAPTAHVFAEMEDCRLAHAIALTLTRARQEPDWLDPLQADLSADTAAHVLPHFANMIRVLQALYVFADRGVRRSWEGGEVLELPGAEALQAKIGEILRSVMPYAG
jgi:hypothetical protein